MNTLISTPQPSVSPDEVPARTALSLALDAFDAVYDPKKRLFGQPGTNIGYHTRLTEKDWVHPTRENFQYALALLVEGRPDRAQRGLDILEVLLDLQDVRDESRTYGIWSWFADEPLEAMNPPDWNWAGFCGMQISIILAKVPEVLTSPIKARLESALNHCCRSIIRRDIKAHYTNIAYLSALVTLAAGDLLARPEYTVYGRGLLEQIEQGLDYHGNYNEYNSPTYTLLLIQLCDCILQTNHDQQGLATAEKLRRRTWEIIAAYFHPATAQWAGPQSRSYGTWLDENTVREISERIGWELPCRQKYSGKCIPLPTPSAIERLACPPEIAKRFLELPEDDYELVQCFIRKESREDSVIGTTWFSHEACLGSVNQETFWIQRRVVLGYWKTEEDPGVQLRLRFLHDGRDFVSAWGSSHQAGPRVLTAISFLIENGDDHPVFYFPEDSVFSAEDFRVRYELLGKGVTAKSREDGRFELRAGDRAALIQPLVGTFDGKEVEWRMTEVEGGIAVDGICYAGPRRLFPFKKLVPSHLAFGLELVAAGKASPKGSHEIRLKSGKEKSSVAWHPGGHSLGVAFCAEPHQQP